MLALGKIIIQLIIIIIRPQLTLQEVLSTSMCNDSHLKCLYINDITIKNYFQRKNKATPPSNFYPSDSSFFPGFKEIIIRSGSLQRFMYRYCRVFRTQAFIERNEGTCIYRE